MQVASNVAGWQSGKSSNAETPYPAFLQDAIAAEGLKDGGGEASAAAKRLYAHIMLQLEEFLAQLLGVDPGQWKRCEANEKCAALVPHVSMRDSWVNVNSRGVRLPHLLRCCSAAASERPARSHRLLHPSAICSGASAPITSVVSSRAAWPPPPCDRGTGGAGACGGPGRGGSTGIRCTPTGR